MIKSSKMYNDRILIKNIYYMLSYAFDVLKQSDYKKVYDEDFDNVEDLFAAILVKGVSRLVKQGLYREYITQCDNLSVMRGKLNINETIKNRVQRKQQLFCEFDELSEDNLLNQILKVTMNCLIRDEAGKRDCKARLKKLLVFFDNVSLIQPNAIQWERLRYKRDNKNYEMLLNVCYLLLKEHLQTNKEGQYKMATFYEDNMPKLYEKFILEYYRKHHKYLSDVKAAQIKWDLQDENDNAMIKFLPKMQTDIFLRYNEKVLILDAKYYSKTMIKHFDKLTLRSNHLYQIFTYVKNEDKTNSGDVAGLLVYAKTDEDITPDCVYNMGGNIIGAKTLDLNREFDQITSQLDSIVEELFGKHNIEGR